PPAPPGRPCTTGWCTSTAIRARTSRCSLRAEPLPPAAAAALPPGGDPAWRPAQVDWGEFLADLGDGPQRMYALLMVLSHSRKEAVVWCRRMDQLAWHHAHNGAFRRLDGVPAVLRIDNLKTGVGSGAGPWARSTRATGPTPRRSASTSTPACRGRRRTRV